MATGHTYTMIDNFNQSIMNIKVGVGVAVTQEDEYVIDVKPLKLMIDQWRAEAKEPESECEAEGEALALIRHTERRTLERIADMLETQLVLLSKNQTELRRIKEQELLSQKLEFYDHQIKMRQQLNQAYPPVTTTSGTGLIATGGFTTSSSAIASDLQKRGLFDKVKDYFS